MSFKPMADFLLFNYPFENSVLIIL